MFREVPPRPLFVGVEAPMTRTRPTSVLFGWSTLLACALLVAGASAACASRVLGVVFDAALVVANTYQVLRLGYLVFGTRGEGHYALTPWRLVDSLLCNALVHVAVAFGAWKMGGESVFVGPAFAGGPLSPWHALYETLVYGVVFYAGGGVTDTLPARALRFVSALEWVWHNVALLVLFAAAVATLQAHTDEKP